MSAMGFVLGSFRGHKRAGVDRWPPCGYCLPAGFCKRASSSHRSQGPREHQAGEQGVVIRQHSQWVGRWTGISESEDPMMLEKQHRELRVHILHQGQALLASAPWRDLRGDLLTHPTRIPLPQPHPHTPSLISLPHPCPKEAKPRSFAGRGGTVGVNDQRDSGGTIISYF